MEYSLIAVDIDGTLLNDHSELSDENIKSIEALSQKGIAVVPVTGRTYYEIPKVVRDCESIRFFVYSNGSCIFDRDQGTVYSSTIPCDTAAEIFSLLDSYETYTEVYSGGYPWADAAKLSAECFDYYGISRRFQKIIEKSRKTVSDFSAELKSGRLKPELFNSFFRFERERDACQERLYKRFPDIEAVSSLGLNLEVMNEGTNKGTGLMKLCDIIGIDTAEVIAIGDNENDIRLFEIADRRCAVSNACDKLKSMATDIICSNNEHVIDYVEKNILC